jgi:hypothetical protein
VPKARYTVPFVGYRAAEAGVPGKRLQSALQVLPKQLLCGDLGRYPSALCRTKLTPTLDH